MKKLRIGILGIGQRACRHGGCAFAESDVSGGTAKDMVIAALCDIRDDRLAEGKQMYESKFGYPIETYTDYETMYARADLDAVYVCGPNFLHRDMTVSALRKGIHVLCEKPMELTLGRCDEMIRAAREANRVLALSMQMHYRLRYHKVDELIQSGAIGKPAMLWCTEYRPPFIAMKDWVWQKSKSGGAIVEKNCHHYDLLSLWVKSKPTTVYATGNIMKHKAPHGFTSEIVDNAWIVNDYACGARAMVGICFLASDAQGHYREFGIQGTEGKIVMRSKESDAIHLQRSNGETETLKVDGELRGGLYTDFLESIKTGGQPLVTGELGRDSLLVPLAAEKSMEERRVVSVAELA